MATRVLGYGFAISWLIFAVLMLEPDPQAQYARMHGRLAPLSYTPGIVYYWAELTFLILLENGIQNFVLGER